MKFFNLKHLLCFLFCCATMFSQTPTGELKRWHKLKLTFNGPNTSETANPNPFSDFRLDVTFTHTSSNRSYTVPGFFDACGNAENNSCSSGNKWSVNFSPDQTGSWSWKASFKKGTDVAINGGGSSGGFMDGATGNFSVAESDKTGRDYRAKNKGRLQYIGEHYLRFTGTNPTKPNGDWFVKAGADSPENAFNYVDFDATPSYTNNLNKIGSKTWQPHQQDYAATDASAYTWANGKGTEILGMVNYLHKQGANVMSFLTWNTSGDCGAVFPHILKVSLQEYGNTGRSQQWNKVHKDRFDVSKMAQWEKVMEYADKKGIYLHFKTMETENDNKMDGNTFGKQRKLYYRELIARFSHHLALNWNLTEETTLPNNVVKATATYIKQLDPYNHNIVIHTYPGEKDQRYTPLLGNASDLTGASLQSNQNSIHNDVINWLKKSKNSGKKWVVANDEQGSASQGIRVSDKDVRKKVLWGTLLAGGAGVEYYSGYLNDDGDINGNDHRKRGKKYKEGSYALDFFNTHLQSYLIDMVSSDGVTNDGGDFVFAKPSEVYVVYRPNGGSTGLSLPTGNGKYNVQWFNPRTGGNLSGKNTLGGSLVAPDNNDWVALITKKDNTGGGDPGDGDGDGDCVALEQGGVVAVEAEHFVGQSKTSKRQWYKSSASNLPGPDPDPEHNTGASDTEYIEILPDTRVTHGDPLAVGESFSNTPGQVAIIDYKIKFTSPGKYFVWVRAHSTGSEDNGVHVGIDGTWPASGQRMQWCTGKNKWTWESKQRTGANHCGEPEKIFINVPTAGIHTVSFSMREDGFEMDKFVLSKTYTKPVGVGPAEVLTDCGGGNESPQVSLTSPVNGSNYSVNETIQLTANASDADGTVAKVEFFANGSLIATENTAPYITDTTIAQAGTYSITAKATDNSGAVTTSSPVSITVKAASEVIQLPSNIQAENYTSKSGTVKIEDTPQTTGQNIGFIQNGDYTEYEVSVPSSGEYIFDVYASSKGSGGEVEFFEDGISVGSVAIPVNGDWHQYTKYSANIDLTSGESTLRLVFKGTTGYLFNVDRVNVIKNHETEQEATFAPVQDSYLQGGANYNSDMIRIENGKRVGYLLFDLSSISGKIEKASLSFTVYSDSGSGIVQVHKGNSVSWTETNLSNTNKPGKGSLLGQVNKNYNVANEVVIPLNVSTLTNSPLSLLVSMTNGNDFAFASKENASVAAAKLSVTYTSQGQSTTVTQQVRLFPNPVVDRLHFSNDERISEVKLFSPSGTVLKEQKLESSSFMNVSDVPKGFYFIKLYDKNGNIISEKKIIKR
ncbi:carbohydrate-binding protein [Tenacibaculum sp. M341]|uniref:carbohydrate-binding protein n=1 Tax=Tenacibaculum sp. M341 TaxID=2530339 RepID=UPI0010435DB6|nr:carbohydrate-binding protein [Tenacibaculum sp. M341]TCI84506.1 carbohydrate-binding protein [Tenacibaculum sp. M341]